MRKLSYFLTPVITGAILLFATFIIKADAPATPYAISGAAIVWRQSDRGAVAPSAHV